MAIIHDLTQLPAFKNPVLTIGSFDGVHHGHKTILKQVVEEAKKIDGESILITFHPHPRKIIHPESPLGLLTAPKQKMQLITETGVDHIVVVPFSREFSMMSAADYIDNFLWKNFHPKVIVLGYDHKFGHSREGNIDLLRKKLSPKVKISEIPAQLIDDATVSSTKIRKALSEGQVVIAKEMLERPYIIDGTVVHGDKLGRALGFPTANLKLNFPDILVPKYGIYMVRTVFDGKHYPSLLSIGVRPTINEANICSIETYILDFNENLYGQELQIEFLQYLRPEKKCNTMAALIAQMQDDEKQARAYFSKND